MGVKVESDRVRVLEKMPEGVLPPLRTSGGALLPHARSVGLDLSSPENCGKTVNSLEVIT